MTPADSAREMASNVACGTLHQLGKNTREPPTAVANPEPNEMPIAKGMCGWFHPIADGSAGTSLMLVAMVWMRKLEAAFVLTRGGGRDTSRMGDSLLETYVGDLSTWGSRVQA